MLFRFSKIYFIRILLLYINKNNILILYSKRNKIACINKYILFSLLCPFFVTEIDK